MARVNEPLLTSDELTSRLGELYDALDQFNHGYFFESHETLEDLWMVTPWPERQLFQGIIQIAAAFVHFFRSEYPGILKLLDAARDKLEDFTPERFGINVAGLLEDIRRCRAELIALGIDEFRSWDRDRIPMIRFERGT